jgi:hypothetical protein
MTAIINMNPGRVAWANATTLKTVERRVARPPVKLPTPCRDGTRKSGVAILGQIVGDVGQYLLMTG